MRFTKMFGLALVAAIAVMAIAGAGSASAVLCKVKQSPCQAANQYPVPSTVLVSSPAVKLVANVTVLCKSHATLVHEGLDVNGKLKGKFTKLEWSGCTGCTEVTTTSLGKFKDEAVGSGNGKLFPEEVTVLLKGCPFGAECTAKSITGTTFLSLTGGTINGTANGTAKTTVKVEGGSLCSLSGTGTWETESGNPYLVLEVNGSKTGEIFQE
jgi:hypothetical protein